MISSNPDFPRFLGTVATSREASIVERFPDGWCTAAHLQWKLRKSGERMSIKPADGSEKATLPANWQQGVYVLDADDNATWIGKRVREDQLPGILERARRLDGYKDLGDGWVLE